MNIKKIIQEEINDFDWAEGIDRELLPSELSIGDRVRVVSADLYNGSVGEVVEVGEGTDYDEEVGMGVTIDWKVPTTLMGWGGHEVHGDGKWGNGITFFEYSVDFYKFVMVDFISESNDFEWTEEVPEIGVGFKFKNIFTQSEIVYTISKFGNFMDGTDIEISKNGNVVYLMKIENIHKGLRDGTFEEVE